MWREPLTGNMGENFESHKPVHETTTGSCTGGNATKWDSHLRGFFAGCVTDSVIDTTASEALP
jgi:hypothetical protein